MFSKRLFTTFKPGDVVLLRSVVRGDKIWLSKPLELGGKTDVNNGSINHDKLFNLKSRSILKSTNGKSSYIATLATTEDYITLGQRDAQPIYPYDAAAIVTLADLHYDFPELTNDNQLVGSPIQILEAGTGHGSLALAICSRLHPTNCFLQKFNVRGGILHSIDCNVNHSRRGEITLEHFKRGMYRDDVKFHLAESPVDWLQNHSEGWKLLEKHDESESFEDKEGFLSAAFLDMPEISSNVSQISKNLKQDASLVIFCPSVTQILEVIKTIKDSEGEIKLSHIRTIQLAPGMGGGLQDWDVRFTHIRASNEEGIVCRPKVASRVVGGGFVAIFKKLPNDAQIRTNKYE